MNPTTFTIILSSLIIGIIVGMIFSQVYQNRRQAEFRETSSLYPDHYEEAIAQDPLGGRTTSMWESGLAPHGLGDGGLVPKPGPWPPAPPPSSTCSTIVPSEPLVVEVVILPEPVQLQPVEHHHQPKHVPHGKPINVPVKIAVKVCE